MQAINLVRQNQDFDQFYFVTKIRPGKDDFSRPVHYWTVQIQDGFAMATNAYRMHIAVLCGKYENGVHTIEKRTKGQILLVPYEEKSGWGIDWKDILPFSFDPIKCDLDNAIEIHGSSDDFASYVDLCKHFDKVINFYYFNDLMEDEVDYSVTTDDEKPIYFFNENRIALIMPIYTK